MRKRCHFLRLTCRGSYVSEACVALLDSLGLEGVDDNPRYSVALMIKIIVTAMQAGGVTFSLLEGNRFLFCAPWFPRKLEVP